jgi:hypothetical protein
MHAQGNDSVRWSQHAAYTSTCQCSTHLDKRGIHIFRKERCGCDECVTLDLDRCRHPAPPVVGWMPRGVNEHLDNPDSFIPGWGAVTARSVDAETLPLDGPEGAHTT